MYNCTYFMCAVHNIHMYPQVLMLLFSALMKYVSWKNMTTSSEYQNEVFFESCYFEIGPSIFKGAGCQLYARSSKLHSTASALLTHYAHLFDFTIVTLKNMCQSFWNSLLVLVLKCNSCYLFDMGWKCLLYIL